jgi:hypothetical protein
MRDIEIVPCYGCHHDVDDHDERARCLDALCSCGWGAKGEPPPG